MYLYAHCLYSTESIWRIYGVFTLIIDDDGSLWQRGQKVKHHRNHADTHFHLFLSANNGDGHFICWNKFPNKRYATIDERREGGDQSTCTRIIEDPETGQSHQFCVWESGRAYVISCLTLTGFRMNSFFLLYFNWKKKNTRKCGGTEHRVHTIRVHHVSCRMFNSSFMLCRLGHTHSTGGTMWMLLFELPKGSRKWR